MRVSRFSVLPFCSSLLLGFGSMLSAQGTGPSSTPEAIERPAHFRVTDQVVNPDVPPITATIGIVGNSIFKFINGYEPQHYRNQWRAAEDSRGRIVVGPSLTNYDFLGDGFLDGGFVRVYRVIDGKIHLVVEEDIAENGFVLRDWFDPKLGQVIPAGTEEYFHKWAGWEDGEHTYWFAVAAVNSQGKLSPLSDPIDIVPPANFKDAPKTDNPRKRVRGKAEGETPAAPRNLRYEALENGQVRLAWDPVESDDLAGYVIVQSNTDPATHEGFFIRLADPEVEILEGDMVIAGKKFDTFTSDIFSPRIRNESRSIDSIYGPDVRSLGLQDKQPEGTAWHLSEHGQDTPVAEPGETYLEVSLEPGSKGLKLGAYTHSGTEQDWYEVLHPGDYQVEFWMRHQGESPATVRFEVQGYDLEPVSFQPGGEWERHTATITIPEIMEGSRPHQSILRLSDPGVYGIDNLRFYRADTPYLDYTDTEYERVRESGLMSLRTHAPIKTGTTTYSMDQFLNPGGVISGIGLGNTLPQSLAIMEKADVLPWLQIEFHMSPEEWLAFVEYIAAPFDPATDSAEDLPYAARRYNQGRERPWTEAFDTIYFELSNETSEILTRRAWR